MCAKPNTETLSLADKMDSLSARPRPPLPSYEEATGQRTHSSIGQSADARRNSTASSVRTHSSIGLADSVQRAAVLRRIQQRNNSMIPRKPARKFPPILENDKSSATCNKYGSCGYFNSEMTEGPQRPLANAASQNRHAVMGSSPNLADFSRSVPRDRNSCVSLDDEKLLNPSPRELLQYRQMLAASSNNGSASNVSTASVFAVQPRKQVSSSTDSLLVSEPRQPVAPRLVGYSRDFRGSAELPRPTSASDTFSSRNMPQTQMSRIHTNGSLQHLIQAQQQRQTPTNTDTLPLETSRSAMSMNGIMSVHGDHTDNVSVASVNSATSHSGSDSGKATSQNSGDAGSGHEDALLGLMDDFHGGSHGKTSDTWRMLPDVNHVPWNDIDIGNILQSGRLQSLHESGRFTSETIPYLSQLLKYPFLRFCIEISRLCHGNHSRCTKRDVLFAAQRVLPFSLFIASKTACQQAAAFYASTLSGDQSKASKSSHSGLVIDVGKIHGFMIEKRLAKFIHDLAAVYLAAMIQNVLEELLLECAKNNPHPITSYSVERKFLNDPEFFAIFQTWRHLPAGRTVAGKVTVPVSMSTSSPQLILGTGFRTMEDLNCAIVEGSNVIEDSRKDRLRGTTGAEELTIRQMHWSSDALTSLHFFLGPDPAVLDCSEKEATPPLIEWLRVLEACTTYRRSTMIEKDDVMEAARILLPCIDYPPHLLSLNDELQYFQAISKPRLLNDFNQAGLTPLMVACIRGDVQNVRSLITAGAKVNLSVPPVVSNNKLVYSRVHPDSQNWTALHFAVAHGSLTTAKHLLDNGAWVEGAAVGEDVISETPLQIAAACGYDDMTSLLVTKGADPFLSTLSDEPSFNAEAQRGTQPALVLAAAHGRRRAFLRMLATSAFSSASNRDDISLEEILEEANGKTPIKTINRTPRRKTDLSFPNQQQKCIYSKEQLRVLNAALYQAAENGFLDIVIELVHIGVSWKVYTWTRSVSLLSSSQRSVMRDFLESYWSLPSEELFESKLFRQVLVPMLFDLGNGCLQQLAILRSIFKIISHVYGPERVPSIAPDLSAIAFSHRKNIPHVKFNDQLTSDLIFQIDKVLVYVHREVVGDASTKFRDLIAANSDEPRKPIELPNIRLKEFYLVMQYVYERSSQKLVAFSEDVQELMTAAHFFELPGLLRFCEILWSRFITAENVLHVYHRAKVCGAVELERFCEGFILQTLPDLSALYEFQVAKVIFTDPVTMKQMKSIVTERVRLRNKLFTTSSWRP